MRAINRLRAAALLAAALGWTAFTPTAAAAPVEPNPCQGSIDQLLKSYKKDAAFRALLDRAFENIQPLPAAYDRAPNPWKGQDVYYMADFFAKWCTFLPSIDGSHDDGLEYIGEFAWFYYRNEYGVAFVQTEPGKSITQQFTRERGKFMDSKASTDKVGMWLDDPRIEKDDYNLPDPTKKDGGFNSFNEFFARTLKDQAQSRPQTMPERDYVIAAPTDCIMNSIPQRITDLQTKIPTKFNAALNIVEMLDGSEHAEKFVGGTALSCVLMPNTYHHYHAPVSGKVVEAKIIEDPFYGYDDFPKWVPPNGNVGYHGTEFSQFENFQRGYFIADTGKFGHVAMIPVGLDTISSIVFNKKYDKLLKQWNKKGEKKKGKKAKAVKITRGDEMGHFLYGGSLFIMIFEPGKYGSDAIQVRLGNQIGTFDTPTP